MTEITPTFKPKDDAEKSSPARAPKKLSNGLQQTQMGPREAKRRRGYRKMQKKFQKKGGETAMFHRIIRTKSFSGVF